MSAAKRMKVEAEIELKIIGVERSVSVKRSVLVSNGVDWLKAKTRSFTLSVKYPGPSSVTALEALIKFMETGEFQPTMGNIEHLFYLSVSFKWNMNNAVKILLDFLHVDLAKRNPGQTDRKVVLMLVRMMNSVQHCANRIGYKRPKYNMTMVDDQRKNWKGIYSLGCTIFIASGFKSVMFEKCVLDLNVTYFGRILSSYVLNITEEDVLKTVKMWVNHDYTARKQHFPDLIRNMRYDAKMKIDFIMEQLLCGCKADCECLTAKDYVLEVLVQRSGYIGDVTGAGPKIKEKRTFYKNWQNQGPVGQQ